MKIGRLPAEIASGVTLDGGTVSAPTKVASGRAGIQPDPGAQIVVHPASAPPARSAHWLRSAVWARRLAWVGFVCVLAEGSVGFAEGVAAGSIALTAWALGGAPEAFASLIVIWRFSGHRTLSSTAEGRAQRGEALSFWLNAPYMAAESVHHLMSTHAGHTSALGIAVTLVALLRMPILGWAQHRLGTRLGSVATVGKGIQNYLCAAQAAAVLLGLAVTGMWPDGWWLDPVVGLVIAGVSVWQSGRSWRGKDCRCWFSDPERGIIHKY